MQNRSLLRQLVRTRAQAGTSDVANKMPGGPEESIADEAFVMYIRTRMNTNNGRFRVFPCASSARSGRLSHFGSSCRLSFLKLSDIFRDCVVRVVFFC